MNLVGKLPFSAIVQMVAGNLEATELGMGSAQERLTKAANGSTFVLMEVETLGMARSLGWKVHMRAPMAIGKARDPCGDASIASSLISRRWSARADQISRFHVEVAAHVSGLWKSDG